MLRDRGVTLVCEGRLSSKKRLELSHVFSKSSSLGSDLGLILGLRAGEMLLGHSERKPVDQVAFVRVYAGWNGFRRKVREEGRHPVLYTHLLGRKPREGAALPGGNAEDVRAAPASRPPTWDQPNPGRVATTGPAVGLGEP